MVDIVRFHTRTRHLAFAAACCVCLAVNAAPAADIAPSGLAAIVVTHTGDSGPGSLRQAILDANTTVVVHSIHFAIPGIGPHAIVPTTPLPEIQRALTIDGYTQPGASENTRTPDEGGLDSVLMIELIGTPATGALLKFMLPDTGDVPVVVRGLALRGGTTAIQIPYLYAGARIEGNYIGTDASGTIASETMQYGIAMQSGVDVVIGGTDPASRNLISGVAAAPWASGIEMPVSGRGPRIVGNLIGTDRSGAVALPNTTGIVLGGRPLLPDGPGAFVGGSDPALRNVISGNLRRGILVNCPGTGAGPCSDGLQISGNHIGTDVFGGAPLPNGTEGGIDIYNVSNSPSHTIVGGPSPAFGNVIAFNAGPGVRNTSSGTTLEIVGNTIHDNAGGDIDIGAYGATPNDADDADKGPNRSQNAPKIVAATFDDDVLTVRYRVDTAVANAAYPLQVQFHASGSGAPLLTDAADPLGRFVIDIYIAADAQIEREAVFVLAPGSDPSPITAIATDAVGNSSEVGMAFDPSPLLFADGFEQD